MDLSTISIIVTMVATAVIAWYAAASYRLASKIQEQEKYLYTVGVDKEISERQCKLKQIKEDLDTRIKQKHLREKINLSNPLFKNQSIKTEKNELAIESYRAIDELDQLIKDYNHSYDNLEKAVKEDPGNMSMDTIINKWNPDDYPGTFIAINRAFQDAQEKLKKIQPKIEETLKVIDDYLKVD